MRHGLAALGASVAIGITACGEAPDATKVEAGKSSTPAPTVVNAEVKKHLMLHGSV